MAQLAVTKSPDRIETQALGSCIGIVLYEPFKKIGGLSHAMLPDMNDVKEDSRTNPAKFVNTAIEKLLKEMTKEGANKMLIEAKLVGGANMFPDISKEASLHIGRRNADAAKDYLNKAGISVIAEDVGGSRGRTISLDTETGRLKVRTVAQGEAEI